MCLLKQLSGCDFILYQGGGSTSLGLPEVSLLSFVASPAFLSSSASQLNGRYFAFLGEKPNVG